MRNDRSGTTLRWLVGALALACASAAHAFPSGIATTSFPVPALGCNFCHGGGSPPTVILACADCGVGPPAVEPLSVHEFTLTVVEIDLQDHAGLNVSSPLGVLSTGGTFAANTHTIVGSGGRQEITHSAPKLAAAGMTQFSFLWTAPASAATVTLAAWGNAVNADGTAAGDAASTVALDVAVGGDSPTATDTPDVTLTPTPTPTPAGTCPATADAGCAGGFAKGLLLIRADVGKEKLIAKLLKGPALVQTDLGNPLDSGQGGTGTAYSLCLYDGAGGLAGGITVDRAGDLCDGQPCWKAVGRAPNDALGPGRGYKYKDAAATADGVRKILYKGGEAGSSKAILIGKGSGLPGGIPAALQSSAQVTVQLRSSDGACLSAELSAIKAQNASYFRAK